MLGCGAVHNVMRVTALAREGMDATDCGCGVHSCTDAQWLEREWLGAYGDREIPLVLVCSAFAKAQEGRWIGDDSMVPPISGSGRKGRAWRYWADWAVACSA